MGAKQFHRLPVLLVLAGLFSGIVPLAAATRTEVSLLLYHDSARPGETITAGIRLRAPAGWHTYWKYSGDSGDPTTIAWALPASVSAGELLWPVPEKLIEAGFTTYIYEGEVVLLAPVTIAANATAGPAALRAKVGWQECEKVCVFGQTEVTASLIIGAESKPSASASLLATWRGKMPELQAEMKIAADWEKPAAENPRALSLAWTVSGTAKSVDFFPLVGGDFTVKGETETLSPGPGTAKIRKLVEKTDGAWPTELTGVFVERGDTMRAQQVRFAIGGAALSPAPGKTPTETTSAPAAATSANAGDGSAKRSLAVILLFAFLGGLILNVMPCVLPVIALKVFSFVNQSKESPGRVRTLGLIYGLGVLVSFVALASVAIGVQQAGGLASWGMLLQNHLFRVVMTVLILLVALNLFGVFEVTLGGNVMGAAGNLAAREGLGGAFFNGVLATVLATPCTAPFLSAALAFAFTQPPIVTLLVFLTVGLGLAAPFVLLCWEPGWLKFMPRPGKWMEHFRTAMGFPMLATAMWLFWFTAPSFGDSGVLWLGLFLVTLAASAWVWGTFVQRSSKRRGLAAAASLLLLAFGYGWILEGNLHWRKRPEIAGVTGSLKEGPDGIDWLRWSPDALARARAQGRPVLVDFTAKNCLNCQVNKRTSLEIAETRSKLKAINAISLLGDFSNADPLIAAELRRYNRPGVPLVLVYPREADKQPIVLPEILTPSLVLDALSQAVK